VRVLALKVVVQKAHERGSDAGDAASEAEAVVACSAAGSETASAATASSA
jgi:hypothetical protein